MVSGTDELALATRPRLFLTRVTEAQFGAILLVLALAVGAAWRLWFASVDDSIYWPDEIYQSLEPAHGLVYGYGLRAWEFVDGARSWFFPGVLAGFLWTFDSLGLNTPAEYLPAFELLFCAIGVVTAWGCWSLARSLGASPPASAAAAAIFALAAPMIYFAPRALGETASAAPIVWAFALALRADAGRRSLTWAASLLGIAVLMRLQNGLFCLGLLAMLAGERRWADLRHAFLVLCLWAGLFGVLDWVTWGRPFHSALVYIKFNLIDGRASEFGVSPGTYYLQTFFTAMPLLTVAGAVLLRLGYRRQRPLAQMCFVYLLLLSLIPHKEFRFVVPALPILCGLAALGVDEAAKRVHRWGGAPAAASVIFALGLLSALGTHRLTYSALGQITSHRPPGTLAADWGGSSNRLMRVAGGRSDLCGLYIRTENIAWVGAQIVTHNPAPLFTDSDPHPHPVNYAVVPATEAAALAGEVVAADGAMRLVRLERPTCRQIPREGGGVGG
jgi:hypothetical protein